MASSDPLPLAAPGPPYCWRPSFSPPQPSHFSLPPPMSPFLPTGHPPPLATSMPTAMPTSMATKSASCVLPIVRVASFNLASSVRDEQHIPLCTRLEAIQTMLRTCACCDILCLQEVRGSGPLSAFDILEQIRKCMGPTWEYQDFTANSTKKAFHRTIFWNSDLFRLYRSEPIYVAHRAQDRKARHFYLLTKTWFVPMDAPTFKPAFSILNVHAPTSQMERFEYWKVVHDHMDPYCIAVGDFNKFNVDQSHFDAQFVKPLQDLIPVEKETFVSFPYDRKPSSIPGQVGELWRSSLDGVIVDTNVFRGEAVIQSTEHMIPRPTDHFLITVSIFMVPTLFDPKTSTTPLNPKAATNPHREDTTTSASSPSLSPTFSSGLMPLEEKQ